MDGLFIRKMEMDLEDDVNEVLKLERVISYYICLCGKFNFDIIVYWIKICLYIDWVNKHWKKFVNYL